MHRKWLLGALALSALAACSSDSDPDSDDGAACAGALPVAVDDQGEIRRGGIVTLDVLANDSDPGCGDIRIVSIGDAAHGNVAIDEGRLVYMPSRNYIGADSFSYTIANDEGEDTAEVAISVFESLTLEGRVELHSGVNLSDFTQADVTLTYGDDVAEGTVNDEGEYTLSLRVYDTEDLTWGRLDVVLGYSEEGQSTTLRSELHSWLPPHVELLESAELLPAGNGSEAYTVRGSAQPGLKVTAFSSAFYALSQPYAQAFDESSEASFADVLSEAALTIDARLLQDIAGLNASLVDGVRGLHDIRVPSAATNFVGLVNDSSRLTTALEQVKALDKQPQFSRDVFSPVNALDLQGRHLQLDAQLVQWLRAYGYTWKFGVNDLARTQAAQAPALATYVLAGENLYFSHLLDAARLLYADSRSMWFSATDANSNPLTFRLMKDTAFKPSKESFDLTQDWVMPATAGQAMEVKYRFHEDGTFTTSHSNWLDDAALQSGTWALKEEGTSLVLTQDDTEVRVQRLVSSGRLPLVMLEDMQNQSLRIGPAMAVEAEVGVVSRLTSRRLLSLFEVRGPEHWREGELVGTPEVDVTFLSSTGGTISQRTYSYGFDWQVEQRSDIAEVIVMQGQSAGELELEQRLYWLPLRHENGRLTVLEWARLYTGRGSIQLSTPPRINIYCEASACAL